MPCSAYCAGGVNNADVEMRRCACITGDWLGTGKNVDGSTVEVCLAKPAEKGSIVRWTRSPATSGKVSPVVS